MNTLTMALGTSVIVHLVPLDDNGQPGALSSQAPVTVSSNTNIAIVADHSSDGLQFTLVSEAPGTVDILSTGQAPSGATFTSTLTLTVQANPATHFDFTS